MVISVNSQLGLRLSEKPTKIEFLELLKDSIEKKLSPLKDYVSFLDKSIVKAEEPLTEQDIEAIELERSKYEIDVAAMKQEKVPNFPEKDANFIVNLLEGVNSKYFFICDSVYKAAELVRIGEGFTARTLKDIPFGIYTYLMGKNKTVRFCCELNYIRGYYFDDANRHVFEFVLNVDTGEFYAPSEYGKIFSMVMQVLTFVELGDIEVIELAGGRNNGKPKNDGKITNTANNTVYVVDSSWNKLIIRTEGFAVRGHFKLQPCGPGGVDRKLIWLNAYEKHGYVRRPKAEIVR